MHKWASLADDRMTQQEGAKDHCGSWPVWYMVARYLDLLEGKMREGEMRKDVMIRRLWT